MNSRTAPSRRRNKKTNKQRASTRQKHAGPRQEALRRHCGPPLQPRPTHPCGTLSPPSLRPHCSPPSRGTPLPLSGPAQHLEEAVRGTDTHTPHRTTPFPGSPGAPAHRNPGTAWGAAGLARATHGSPLPTGRGQGRRHSSQNHPQEHTAHPCRRPLVIPSAPRLAPFLGGRRPQRYARLAPADTAPWAFLRPCLCIPPPRAAVFRGARTASAQHTVLLRNPCESLPLFSGWQNFFLGTFTRVWEMLRITQIYIMNRGILGIRLVSMGVCFVAIVIVSLLFSKGYSQLLPN